ncbi:MAG: 4-hydroxy-tetrahydrodipicolinate reductase, partial [Candidatus Puniceispirillaceae bacterium]
MLIREIAAAPGLELVAATDRAESEAIGQDSGLLAGTGTNGVLISDDPENLASADVLVDFTSPAASVAHANMASRHGCAMVVGTTGLSADEEEVLKKAATQIPIVYCANTSVGVTLLGQIVEQIARQLDPEWDIEVVETHHNQKVDAPSGTALALGRAAAKGRDIDLDTIKE